MDSLNTNLKQTTKQLSFSKINDIDFNFLIKNLKIDNNLPHSFKELNALPNLFPCILSLRKMNIPLVNLENEIRWTSLNDIPL